jgi:hypothetical protein
MGMVGAMPGVLAVNDRIRHADGASRKAEETVVRRSVDVKLYVGDGPAAIARGKKQFFSPRPQSSQRKFKVKC